MPSLPAHIRRPAGSTHPRQTPVPETSSPGRQIPLREPHRHRDRRKARLRRQDLAVVAGWRGHVADLSRRVAPRRVHHGRRSSARSSTFSSASRNRIFGASWYTSGQGDRRSSFPGGFTAPRISSSIYGRKSPESTISCSERYGAPRTLRQIRIQIPPGSHHTKDPSSTPRTPAGRSPPPSAPAARISSSACSVTRTTSGSVVFSSRYRRNTPSRAPRRPCASRSFV